jgi:hypothetical protein
MSYLAGRLGHLLRNYASQCEQGDGDTGELWEEFREGLQMLISQYGAQAVDAALDELPDGASPSVSLH